MAAYAVTDWVSDEGTITKVLADMETKLETITDSKTIRLEKVIQLNNRLFVGVLIYDA